MCITCNVLVCNGCVTGNHNGHRFSELVDAVAELRVDYEQKILANTSAANQNIKRIKHSLRSFDKSVESVIKAITDKGNVIKCMVDQSVAQIITEVKEKLNEEKNNLNKMLSDAKSVLVTGQNLDKNRLKLDQTRPDVNMVQQITNLKDEINKAHVVYSLPEFPKIIFNRKSVTQEDIRTLIGSYTIR